MMKNLAFSCFARPLLAVAVLTAALACQSPADPGAGHDASTSVTTSAAALVTTAPDASVVASAAAEPPTRPARVIVKLRGALETAAARNGANKAAAPADPALAALFRKHRIRASAPVHPGRARTRQAARSADADVTARTRQKFPGRAARAPKGARIPDLGGTYVLDLGVRSDAEVAAVLADLRRQTDVVYAEPERQRRALYVPNDPRYGELYGLARLAAGTAWDTTRGQGALVAVVDTGIDHTHPDLDANVWTNPGEIAGNGLDDDGNGYVDDVRGWDFAVTSQGGEDADPRDVHGHGTHVAGTIAAEGDNELGVVGVAWKARVLAAKCLDDSGSGADSSIAAAIVYAVDQGADVINASLGAPGSSQVLTEAVEYAHGLGVVFVAAAGNDSADAAQFSPANIPSAIAVSATDASDALASFSNFGSKIDVAAPGVAVLSLEANTGGYVSFNGTSMATPHVAGVAALVLARHPEFSAEQVRQVLRSSADDLAPAGKDPSFGHGRVNAAAAVLIDEVLEAKILTPLDGTSARAPVALVGTARGPGFTRYVTDYGSGANPTSWTTVRDTTTPVLAGDLGTFSTAMPDGLYTLRLRAFHTSGRIFTDSIQVRVEYLALTSPSSRGTLSTLHVVKPGTTLPIVGRATGPSFQRFAVEWAPGFNATTGWSTAGITLTGNGNAAIENGTLASWATGSTLVGEHTIRLTVVNAGSSSTLTAGVYFEPDLLSAGFPQYVDPAEVGRNAQPVRMADGTVRFVVCGGSRLGGPQGACTSLAMDGTRITVPLSLSFERTPPVGDLDEQPGEEIIIAYSNGLQVRTGDLTATRWIDPTGNTELFGVDPVILADVDRDGTLEIITVSRNRDNRAAASLWVLRSDGTPLSDAYPVALQSAGSPASIDQVELVAADLDRDGLREVVVGVLNRSANTYQIRAYRADGAHFAPFQFATQQPSNAAGPLYAADLDHDGGYELVFFESYWDFTSPEVSRVHVVDARGAERPGWPQPIHSGTFAFTDLDGDGKDEIIVDLLRLEARRLDGTRLESFAPLGAHSQPTIVDLDNDGSKEIITLDATIGRLLALRPDGSVQRMWRIFGLAGLNPWTGQVGVGDFNRDGRADLVVTTSLVGDFFFEGSSVTVLDSRAAYDPAKADWPFPEHDPQLSRAKVDPVVRLGAIADAHVRDGSANAGINYGTATSLEVKTSSAGFNRITYLRFPLEAVRGKVRSAKLRLHGKRSASGAGTDSVFAVDDFGWTETGITWNNRPALGAKVASSSVTSTARYYEWDVTTHLNDLPFGEPSVTLAVKMDPSLSDIDTFNSREAASNRPELVVELNARPTIAVIARATPTTVTGTTTALSVLAADDRPESQIVYTWSELGAPPAPITFGANGTNAAKNSTATFTAPGDYDIVVEARDAGGQTVYSQVLVTVVPTLTSIVVTPASATVATGATRQFTAQARDQFGVALAPQPSFAWSVSGGGTINGSGLFTAGSSAGGPFTVTAASGGRSGTASVTVGSGGTTVTVGANADAYVRDGTSATANFGTATSLAVKSTSASSATRISYLRFALTGVSGTVGTAKLRLYGSRPVISTAVDGAYAVASNSWTETGIVWNNRPALGASQGAGITVGTTAQYYEWDVTAFVKAQKAAGATAVSLAIKMDTLVDHGPDTFNSREATSNKPQLVVTSTP